MDCFVASLLAMTSSGFRNGFAFSRRDAPELCVNVSPENRRRGECRVPAAPAASCALVVWHTSIHHESTGTPGIPARNGFNGFLRALPGARIPFATVVSGLRFCLRPVGPTCLRQLDTSNGCQDHTALPSAATSLVSAPLIAHRPFDPPCDHV